MKAQIIISAVFISVFFCCCTPKDQEPIPVGSIRPVPAREIQGSDLWIGGEVLDRDLCSYDAYKSYLGELGAKKIRLQSGWAKTEREQGNEHQGRGTCRHRPRCYASAAFSIGGIHTCA